MIYSIILNLYTYSRLIVGLKQYYEYFYDIRVCLYAKSQCDCPANPSS